MSGFNASRGLPENEDIQDVLEKRFESMSKADSKKLDNNLDQIKHCFNQIQKVLFNKISEADDQLATQKYALAYYRDQLKNKKISKEEATKELSRYIEGIKVHHVEGLLNISSSFSNTEGNNQGLDFILSEIFEKKISPKSINTKVNSIKKENPEVYSNMSLANLQRLAGESMVDHRRIMTIRYITTVLNWSDSSNLMF